MPSFPNTSISLELPGSHIRRFYNLRLGRLSYVERYVMSPDTAIVEPWQTGLISRLAGAVKL